MQDPLLAILHQSIGSIGPDSEAIKQNILASRSMESDIVAAIEARVRQEELREQYRLFREDCARDLTSIKVECGGIMTFKEWLVWRENTTASERA